MRASEQIGGRRALDDETRVHHVDALGHAGHNAKVVRDQDDRGAMLSRKAAQQFENLGLNRDIQGGRGLVGDEHLGLERERHGDHHPLAHAAAELMWEVLEPRFRLGDADHAQELDRCGACLRLRDAPVGANRLNHLLLDGEHRVQAGHRVLEDHRDVLAPQIAHRGLVEAE